MGSFARSIDSRTQGHRRTTQCRVGSRRRQSDDLRTAHRSVGRRRTSERAGHATRPVGIGRFRERDLPRFSPVSKVRNATPNTNWATSSPACVAPLATGRAATVAPGFAAVRPVRTVAGRSRLPKGSTRMRTVQLPLASAHHAVHRLDRIRTRPTATEAVRLAPPTSTWRKSIPNRSARHFETSFRISSPPNASVTIASVSDATSDGGIAFTFISLAEATQLRRAVAELEENVVRTEQRFNQLQKTLTTFEEGSFTPLA